MELNLTRQTVAINEVVFDGVAEQSVECDVLLPDYCPDIVKILKCAVDTAVTSSMVSADRLTLEGVSTAHVYYMAENMSIRHTEYKIPFSKLVEIRTAPTNPTVTINPTLDYVNCRAVSQRRIDVRGAVSLEIKIIDQREDSVISSGDGEGIQFHQYMVYATKLSGSTSQNFNMEDDLEIGFGKPTISNVVRYDYRADLSDFKVIAGKVVVKGELALHVLYEPEEEGADLEVMEYALPISQIVDCAGVDENSSCDVRIKILSCEVTPKLDTEGDYRLLNLSADLCVDVKAHQGMEIPVASDCYSTLYESRYQSKSVGFMQLIDVIRDTYSHKEALELPPETTSIIDVWSHMGQCSWKSSPDGISISIRINICVFSRLENGEVNYLEYPAETTHEITLTKKFDTLLFSPEVIVGATSYSLSGSDRLETRCDIRVSGCVYSSFKVNSVSEIQINEEAPKVKDYNKLYIYYADAGENTWEIAKRYNTSAGAILAENSIEHETLDKKCMLLIPIV